MSENNNSVKQIVHLLAGRNIVLVGLMGCGKSSIGRKLAERMELPFKDADTEIERAAGKTIPEIFEEDGEEAFRDGERRVISRLLSTSDQVLATGGGAYMNAEVRTTISTTSVSIWLRADLDLLMERVSRRPNRPLLQTKDPRAVMQKLMDERYPTYAQADVVIDSKKAVHDVIVDDLVEKLAEYLTTSGNQH